MRPDLRKRNRRSCEIFTQGVRVIWRPRHFVKSIVLFQGPHRVAGEFYRVFFRLTFLLPFYIFFFNTPHLPHSSFSTLRIFHTPRFPHSAFSTLLVFHTPHFPHSAFSTLCVFHTPHFLHSAFSTLLVFHTPHFPHSSFSTLHVFHTPHFPHSALRTPSFPPIQSHHPFPYLYYTVFPLLFHYYYFFSIFYTSRSPVLLFPVHYIKNM